MCLHVLRPNQCTRYFPKTIGLHSVQMQLENVFYIPDDIYYQSIEENITKVNEILTTLKEAGFTLKISKCSLFTDTVQ